MKEICKLVAEKGFEPKTLSTNDVFRYYISGGEDILNKTSDYLLLCEIQKWIREELNIYISVVVDDLDVCSVIINDKINGSRFIYTEELDESHVDYHTFQDTKIFISYEEALMAGIKETIKTI